MENKDSKNDLGIEFEMGKSNRKFYLKLYFDPVEIWVDTKALPESALLCMLCDGVPIMFAPSGKSRKERNFVNIDWVINDWGGDPQLVDAIKKKREQILGDLDKLKSFAEKSEQNDQVFIPMP